MQVALAGLTQSGKSTLFSAVSGAKLHHDTGAAGIAGHIEKAVVKVPDTRLKVLSDIYKPKKTTPATIEFLDLPGMSLIDEPHRQESRRIIAQARQADMLVLVICCFDNPSVAKYKDRLDPAGDLAILQDELFWADLEQVTNRIERLEKSVTKPTKTQKQDKQELELMRKCAAALEEMHPLTGVITTPEEEKLVRSFGFLTMKPYIVVLNVNEDKTSLLPDDILKGNTDSGDDNSDKKDDKANKNDILVLSAKLEQELASLEDDEREEFLQEMGIKEIARDRLVQSCYKTLKLISFLTSGSDEVRAWTIPFDCEAVEAAGVIHSDIQRGFIRAETVSYDDFMAAGGDMKQAKAAGKVRLEGKNYKVQDGDIINFRFNV